MLFLQALGWNKIQPDDFVMVVLELQGEEGLHVSWIFNAVTLKLYRKIKNIQDFKWIREH